MKIHELVYALSKLPQDMDIYLEGVNEDFGNIFIEPVSETCDDPVVVGYVLTSLRPNDQPVQMRLPFGDK